MFRAFVKRQILVILGQFAAARNLCRYFRTAYGRKNRFPEMSSNQVWTRVGHVPSMLIFEAGIDFVLGFSLPPPENQFHDGIDSDKESTPWNRCQGRYFWTGYGMRIDSWN
jgi:hypothetical protein